MPDKLSPGILSLLPLFYVGWSDSVLSPSEMSLIHKKVRELKFLTLEEKELLVRWTDPRHPPKKAVFKLWLNEMRRLSQDLELEEKESLVEIGLEMARSLAISDQAVWSDSSTVRSLKDIEKSLGITESGSLRVLLSQLGPLEKEIKPSHQILAASVQRVLDGEYIETRTRMRKLLEDPVFEMTTIRDKDDYRKKILEWTKLMAQQGLGAYAYPEKYGGKNSPGKHITVFEMLGYHDLSLAVKFGVQFGLFGGAIYNLGTEHHHDKYLEPLAKANLLGCFAMTETNHGSNVKGLETTLTYDATKDHIVVHTPHEKAGKEYIGNALHSSHAAVFGQLIINGKSKGIHAVVVRLRDEKGELMPGVRVEDNGYKMGLNGVDNGKIWFDNVVIPTSDLLNRYGEIVDGEYQSHIESDSRRFFTMLGALVAGRVSVAWAGVSAAKKSLTIATRYAMHRRQFDSTPGQKETIILDYPTHQRRLLPLIAKTYVLDIAMKKLTELFVGSLEQEDRREVEALAAGLKAVTSWHATRTIQECREACGGKGYLSENQFADLKADTDIFSTFEGDNTVLLQLVSKGLLSEMQKQFHDEGFLSVLRYVTANISTRITEMNPYNTRRTDAVHLTDPDFFRDAFEYRERKLLQSVAQRIRNYISKGVHSSEAFLRCQNHLVELAQAHMDFSLLKSSYKNYTAIEDESLRAFFINIHSLYALSTIEANKGWYLENDYMNGAKTKAIRRLVDKLCRQMRDQAELMIEGFGIPEELIKAPIAQL